MSNPPCLSASSEFNGLTILGVLREADRHGWNAAFQYLAPDVPMQLDEEQNRNA